MENQKLQLVRLFEQLEKSPEEFEIVEYEVEADAHIVGEYEFGPFKFMIWEIGINPPGKSRRLALRIKYTAEEYDYKNAKTDGYYHGGDVAGEFIYFASLFLRRKLIQKAIVRENDRPIMHSSDRGLLDPFLIEGKSNLKDLDNGFTSLMKLKSEFHLRTALSAKLYHQAILILESYPEFSYLNLISAIEVLSNTLTSNDYSIENYHVFELTKQIVDQELRAKIENEFLKKGLKQRKFVAFILKYIDASFWKNEKPKEPGEIRIKPDEIERLLKKVYDARSKLLHDGEPFIPTISGSLYAKDGEMPIGLGLSVGEKKWDQKEFLPNLHFFERLVRHVILEFIKKNSIDQNLDEEEAPLATDGAPK